MRGPLVGNLRWLDLLLYAMAVGVSGDMYRLFQIKEYANC